MDCFGFRGSGFLQKNPVLQYQAAGLPAFCSILLKYFEKYPLQDEKQVLYYNITLRGCSSVVERHVANVNVVSSNLITRFKELFIKDYYSISELPAKQSSLALVADMFEARF
jgi:hypothetical protein